MTDVIVRLKGALGNQMFQYAFAKAVARKLNGRVLLDRSWLDLPNITETYRLDAFKLDMALTSRVQNVIHRLLLNQRLPGPIRSTALAALSMDYEREDDQHLGQSLSTRYGKKPAKRIFCDGYFQRAEPIEHLLEDLREEFHLPVSSANCQKMLDGIESCESVAVHVRRGDYVDNVHVRENMGPVTLDYYVRGFELMRQQLKSPTFYVFSNDPTWVREKLAEGQEDIVVVDGGEAGSDLADLALMRSCKHFIIANSTFSWWSAFLANNPDKIVLAPKPWFILDHMGFDARVPADWIGIPSGLG